MEAKDAETILSSLLADAMNAPVVSRFATYGPVALNGEAEASLETIHALPAMKQWDDGVRVKISG